MEHVLNPEDLPLAGIEQKDRDRLTFGVEFEFGLATLNEGEIDPSPEDDRAVFGVVDKNIDAADDSYSARHQRTQSVLTHVAKTLTEAGIKSIPGLETDTIDMDDSATWVVKRDSSVQGPGEKTPYTWHPVEVITPAFCASSQAIDTVKRMCEILTNTYRINCNSSAGVHVHVGRAEKGFSFETLRNLYATLWTFEPQIQQIHLPYRSDDESIYCSPLSTSDNNEIIEEHERRTLTPTALAKLGLDRILGTKSLMGLGVGLLAEERHSAYNMTGMVKRYRQAMDFGGSRRLRFQKTKNTVEFRQHESTLDPIRATNWARLCIGLLEFSDTVSREALDPFLRRHIESSPEEFTIGQILTAGGMPYLVDFFTQLVTELNAKEAIRRAVVDEKAAREEREWNEGQQRELEKYHAESTAGEYPSNEEEWEDVGEYDTDDS